MANVLLLKTNEANENLLKAIYIIVSIKLR